MPEHPLPQNAAQAIAALDAQFPWRLRRREMPGSPTSTTKLDFVRRYSVRFERAVMF